MYIKKKKKLLQNPPIKLAFSHILFIVSHGKCVDRIKPSKFGRANTCRSKGGDLYPKSLLSICTKSNFPNFHTTKTTYKYVLKGYT